MSINRRLYLLMLFLLSACASSEYGIEGDTEVTYNFELFDPANSSIKSDSTAKFSGTLEYTLNGKLTSTSIHTHRLVSISGLNTGQMLFKLELDSFSVMTWIAKPNFPSTKELNKVSTLELSAKIPVLSHFNSSFEGLVQIETDISNQAKELLPAGTKFAKLEMELSTEFYKKYVIDGQVSDFSFGLNISDIWYKEGNVSLSIEEGSFSTGKFFKYLPSAPVGVSYNFIFYELAVKQIPIVSENGLKFFSSTNLDFEFEVNNISVGNNFSVNLKPFEKKIIGIYFGKGN